MAKAKAKEPFIPQSDRPDVKIDPDKLVSELTVRDLRTIFGDVAVLKSHVDVGIGKNQLGNEKGYSTKDERAEGTVGGIGDAGSGFTRLVEHLGGLHKKIDELADQIAELKKPL